MAVHSDRLYVTYVEPYNGLLKIWGQPNRTCASYIEKQLSQLATELNRSPGISPASVQKGMMYIAKYEDESYYRVRIISDVRNNAVAALFIDYGHKDRIELNNLRMLGSPTDSVISTIIPQAEEYYLANIRSEGGWSNEMMNEIRRGLCYNDFKYRTVCQSGNDKLIQISYRNEDYSGYLIRQELAKPVSVKEQMILIKSTFKNQGMELMGSTFRSPSFNQQLPQSSNRDKYFHANKVQLGAAAYGPPASPLSQTCMFPQQQNRSGIERANGDRHFNVVNPLPRAAFNQGSTTQALADPKGTPVINSVVIEALANHLKQHLMKEQSTPVPETSTFGYVTQVLDVKTTHNVYISCIDDGPWAFSVQLVSNEQELNQLMEELAAYNFQPIKLPLTLGFPCIAKSQKYDSYCRGVMVDITHSAVKVFYVDFGNTEDLPYNVLFEMPPKFFKVKTLSQKFALSGLQKVRPTEEIKKAFVEVVENEMLILHVTNLEGENLPTCDLYLKDVNIKRILNEKLRLVKSWEPAQFPRFGEIEHVLVTCVETAQRFYVQLKRCEPELRELKEELAKYGTNAEILDPEDISPSVICICYYAREKQWYRAIITSVNSMKSVTVFYVDYGYTEMVDIKLLRKVCGGVISKVKVQAIPCCLHGYEGAFRQSSNTSALIELILGREFTLKVISEGHERINVQLFDNGKDVLLGLKNVTIQSKPKLTPYDTKDNSDNYGLDNDSVNKRSTVKIIQSVSGRTGTDRTDSSKGRAWIDSKPEKGKGDALSWRLDERKEPSPKPKDDGKNIKARDVWEPTSETKNEKYNGSKAGVGRPDDSKAGRYGFKANKPENIKVNDKDQKNVEKNWRETENLEDNNFAGVTGTRMKLGETINDRMKRAARQNEERGLKISETMVTKLPLKLDTNEESMAFGGKIRENREIKIGSTKEVLVTYFVNPQEIYVQLASSKEKFRRFMLDIRDYYNTKLPMLNKPKKGDVVMCRFKPDGVLYRAVVIGSDPITVQYVDFGNEEVTERENLWPMDKRFLELECQCIKCILPNIKPIGSETWPAPNSEIDNIFESETYSCTFLKVTEKGYEVKLVNLENGRDVRNELISAGFAYSVEDSVKVPAEDSVKVPAEDSVKVPAEDSVKVQVEDSVKVQVEDSVKELVEDTAMVSLEDSVKELVEDTAMVSLEDSVKELVEDTAKVSLEDSVKELVEDTAMVSLEDSVKELVEDTAMVSLEDSVKELVEDTAMVSLEDSVQGSVQESFKDSIPELSQASVQGSGVDSFQDSVNDPNVIFETETKKFPLPMIKTKKHPKTPFDLLRDEVFNVFVTHVVDATEFYVQIRWYESNAIEKGILKYVKGKEFRSLAGRVIASIGNFCLVNVESNTWYRAEVINEGEDNVTVSLMDCGYQLDVNCERIGPISKELAQYPPQAIRCCLLVRENKPIDELNEMFSDCVKNNYSAFFHEETDKGCKVTLYDSNGEKLKILNYYNSAPDWIRPISDLPIIKRQMQVIVSHISSPQEVYVQLVDDGPELKRIISSLMTFYGKGVPEMTGELSEFEMYAAKSLVDGTWYRAQLLSHDDDSANMFFIDFGNCEEVPKENLRKLDPSFYECYAYAKKVSLNLFYPHSSEKRITGKIQKLVWKKVYPAVFLKVGDNLHAEFVMDDSFLTSQLVSGSVRILQEDMFEKYKKALEIKVYISHMNSPNEFWVHEESICSELTAFQDKLQAACSNGKQQDVISVGDIVGVLFKDNLWYRAFVTSVEGDNVSIRFLDYGNTYDIDKTENEFIALDDELKKQGSFVRKCSLQGVWKRNTISRFEHIVHICQYTFDLVEIDGERNIVDLFHNGSSITEQLINEGYEGPENDDIVFITHINSPTDFYIQKETDQELFDMVIEKMMGADSLQDPYDVVLDELYCARFPEDDLWYRAKVICKDREEIVVNFIDYGNCSVVSEIKDLPEDLKTLHPLSTNCCLVNVSEKNSWSEDAKNYLWKFLNNVPLKMEVVQETSEISVVRLCTKDGEDLSEMLVALDDGFNKATQRGPRIDDIINGKNGGSSFFEEGTVSPGGNDSCPSIGSVSSKGNQDIFVFGNIELPERSQSLSNFKTETVASEWVSQGQSSLKEGDQSEQESKLSYSEKIVPDSISIRRLSLEEVSGRVSAKPEEKLTRSSPSLKTVAGQQQEEDKTLPGDISNGSAFAAAEDKIVPDEGQVTSNGTVGDKKN